MILTTAAQMREADRIAIMDRNIPSLALMETASGYVAEAALAFLERDGRDGGVFCFCGSGNNGGDGIGAAVHLLRRGVDRPVRVLLCGNRAHMTADALAMERQLNALGGVLEDFDPQEPGLEQALAEAAVIVDAIFGIGLARPVEGRVRQAIERINAAGVPVVAADIASGVSADTGEILGTAVRATVTVTFSMAKPGHFVEPGCVCRGRLEVRDIGIPADILKKCETTVHALTDGEALLPQRNPLSHKGDYGKLLILGGSVGYTGAPSLCARAAVRAGAGLVYLGVPAPIYEITAVKNDEAMPFPLAADGDGRIAAEGVGVALERLSSCDVCAVGPGLGKGPGPTALLDALLRQKPQLPMVIDADGLNAIAGDPSVLLAHSGPVVLTPHEGEFRRLGGTLTGDRIGDARRFAAAWNCVLLLKGHRCVAAFPDGTALVATHGNPGMAKGGSGDVLTGILGAMLCQLPLRQAVATAMELHALAGDLCRNRLGEYGLTATDLIQALPRAEKHLLPRRGLFQKRTETEGTKTL